VGTAAAGLLLVLVLVVVVLPLRFTADRHFDKASEELKAQNDVRTALLQALAGGVLLLGAYFTWRQLRVTREGQITDRYTKAVDQLGSEHLDVRVGGIYALERIARDSPDDRATIQEVLTAFVRGHAPWPPPPAASTPETSPQQPTTAATPQPLSTASPAAGTDTAGQPDEIVAERQGPAADVQAAMTVRARRELPPGGLRPLDLERVDLRHAQLIDANLQNAGLYYANLQGAWLIGANLYGARLGGTDLQGAQLGAVDLRGAQLDEADLQGAVANGDTRWPDRSWGWSDWADAHGVTLYSE
jgi:Pentapeptide repeats (8 copies)